MQFSYPITVEPDTAETSPERLLVNLSVGVLQKVTVYFPWGCAGLVGIRILHYEHQLYPTNLDEWFTGNEIQIEYESEYFILEGPSEFKIEAYNLDNFYSHTPIVGFNVLRREMGFQPSSAWIGA